MDNKKLAGHLPDKRSINLALIGKKSINMMVAVPAIIMIALIAFFLGKFAVADRIIAANKAQYEVDELQSKINKGYKTIDEYGDLTELYAHYTYSGMSEEELDRSDRVQIMDMLTRVVLPKAYINSWNVKGNTLVLSMAGNTLQQINLIAQELMEEPNVDYCTVTTATTDTRHIVNDIVEAKITVYLVKVSEEEVGTNETAKP